MLFVFDRGSPKARFEFMGFPAVTSLCGGIGPRAALETVLPPEMERRQDVIANGAGVFPSC
jgi:hypothetical protein